MSENKFVAKELEILKFWQEHKIFAKSLKQTEKSKLFSFYDGPPFATGLPHYGHIVASLMKDVVPRYLTMRGQFVPRRWGWDCHGLPVENLIEQELGIKDKKEIEKDVAKFNQACRDSVLRYAKEWRKTIERLGRWVDLDNDYKTMDIWYMESIWWIFKQLWDKGLIYQGYKSMHICPRCGTTLSNFEVTQNYQEIKDLSIIVKFELIDPSAAATAGQAAATAGQASLGQVPTYILAWTTTPWTLPGNVALALGKDIDYVKVAIDGQNYILAKDNLEKIFFSKNYKVKSRVKAKDLVGKKYKPLFDYYLAADLKNKQNLYTIQVADFVTVEDGTGVVHIAPGFGEDDLNLGKEKNLPTIIHVSPDGRFMPEVKDFAGELVKPKQDTQTVDKKIVQYLRDKNLVVKAEEFVHSYPLCWRCDTPLLNYATTSWFIKVTEIKKDLIKNNEKINWVPSHLKAGRFGKWLQDAKDWAISRSRYWGTPLPVWRCQMANLKSKIQNPKSDDGCGEIKVIGSITELEKLSGQKVTDLHKHIVDRIEFKCEKCGGTMRRIPEVLDCWFESGSMPYAQQHYPFENIEIFKKSFPAKFIAEGIDQTRGWFYTLLVLSTALFNKPAYLNVIANGIVLAEDGAKMSKRLKNYPEPDSVVEKYGADALRYYLLTSPVMEGENLNFSENGVKEAFQKNIMLIANVLSFYKMYQQNKSFSKSKPKNVLDRWILAKLNLLNQQISGQLEKYSLMKASRPITGFINELSTWYLRRSRERFKAGDQNGINTLGFVLLELSKIIAPFIPFIAEDIYQQVCGQKESVHLESWPEVSNKLIDKNLLAEMELVRQIVEKGLSARAQAGIKVRQPLTELRIKNKELRIKDEEILVLIKDELNIKEIIFDEKIKAEIELNINITQDLQKEGLAREVIRQINQLRKEAGLTIDDKVVIYQDGLEEIFSKFGSEIKKATLANSVEKGIVDNMKEVEGGKVGIKKI